MTDHKRRVHQLENKAGGGDELPFKAITQDFYDKNIFRDDAGNIYHESDIADLGQRYSLTVIAWADGNEWRGLDGGSKKIQLSWGDPEP